MARWLVGWLVGWLVEVKLPGLKKNMMLVKNWIIYIGRGKK